MDEKTPLLQSDAGEKRVGILQDPCAWFCNLRDNYSGKLLLTIFVGSHCLKGFVAGGGDAGLLGTPIQFMLSDKPYCLTALEIQVNTAVALSPWGLKPLVGTISDRLPIGGYHRRPYIIATTVVGFAACLTLALTFYEEYRMRLPLWGLILCLFFCFLQVASVDLLLEARQSEEVKAAGSPGPELVRYTWIGINMGQILGIVTVGIVLSNFGCRSTYVVAAPFCGLVLVPAVGNYLREKGSELPGSGCKNLCARNPELIMLTVLISVVVLTMNVAACLQLDLKTGLVPISAAGAFLVGGTMMMLIRPEVSKPTAYYFLHGVLSLKADGALFFFFTNCPEMYPAGPHFSAWFYVAGMGLALFSGFLIGTLTCDRFQSCSYRSIAMSCGLLAVGARLALLPMLTRHVSGPYLDPMWACSVCLLEGIFEAWCWIPRQVMSAMLTPMKLEASGLAVTAGTLNTARTLSALLGAGILCLFNVDPRGKPGDTERMENLPYAYAVCCLLPLLAICLAPVLLPAGSQGEALITDAPRSATHNSPWERHTKETH